MSIKTEGNNSLCGQVRQSFLDKKKKKLLEVKEEKGKENFDARRLVKK